MVNITHTTLATSSISTCKHIVKKYLPSTSIDSYKTLLASSYHHHHHSHRFTPTLSLQRPHSFFASTKKMNNNNNKVRVALLQVLVSKDKEKNLVNTRNEVKKAVEKGSSFIVLPEMFQTPYANDSFPQYAEYIDDMMVSQDDNTDVPSIDPQRSPTLYALQQMSQEHGIWLVGGSISERDTENHIYNTSVVFSPQGRCVAKHRKIHLFDIDVPGKQYFKESDTLTAGNSITVFDTPYGRVGLAICYDMRFPLLFQAMRDAGCSIFVIPGNFNITTGSLHWEAILRARAIDYQCYTMAASQARDESFSYKAWGHSTVVNPWGEVIATTEHQPATVYADLDMNKIDEARKFIPISQQQRHDLYQASSILDKDKKKTV